MAGNDLAAFYWLPQETSMIINIQVGKKGKEVGGELDNGNSQRTLAE